MADCLFCRIVSGELPARIVAQDEHAVAFEDVNPQAPTHVLIVPRKHVSDVVAAEPEMVARVIALAAKVAKDHGLDREGFRLVANTGAKAGQSVLHLHVHLLGGRSMHWPPG